MGQLHLLKDVCTTRGRSRSQVGHFYGYIDGNCRLVTWIYNRAKGSGTDEDVINFAKGVINAICVRQAS